LLVGRKVLQYCRGPCAPPCPPLGDINVDGAVNGLDIGGFVRAKLGEARLPGENPACADYGGDLNADIAARLLTIQAAFSMECPPLPYPDVHRDGSDQEQPSACSCCRSA
jgi:hypothetical protein